MRRLRKFILIPGTLLCVLIAVAFVASAWCWLWVSIPGRGFIAVHAGEVEVTGTANVGPVVGYLRHREGLLLAVGGMNFLTPRSFHLPLIYPFAAVGIPTLLVWRFWPKPIKPGRCPCGYDLRGNVSGVCPECGAEVWRAAGAS